MRTKATPDRMGENANGAKRGGPGRALTIRSPDMANIQALFFPPAIREPNRSGSVSWKLAITGPRPRAMGVEGQLTTVPHNAVVHLGSSSRRWTFVPVPAGASGERRAQSVKPELLIHEVRPLPGRPLTRPHICPFPLAPGSGTSQRGSTKMCLDLFLTISFKARLGNIRKHLMRGAVPSQPVLSLGVMCFFLLFPREARSCRFREPGPRCRVRSQLKRGRRFPLVFSRQ